MKVNRWHVSALWGCALTILLLTALILSLFVSGAPISVAQEATRPAPGPDRPDPGPGRDTPQPPPQPTPETTPQPTTEPQPTDDGGGDTPEVTATPTAVLLMPASGWALGSGITLLLAGLACAVTGVGVSIVRHRRSQQSKRLHQPDEKLRYVG